MHAVKEETNAMAGTRKGESVSGTMALPRYEKRKLAQDVLGEIERSVADAWADMNIREPHINGGEVPIDALCVPLDLPGGKRVPDPHSLQAVNSAVQYFFGTPVGRVEALKLLAVQEEVTKRWNAEKAKREAAAAARRR